MNAPSPEDLQRELEQVRAASTATQAAPQPSVRTLVRKWAITLFVLWFALILMFVAIWFFMNPGK